MLPTFNRNSLVHYGEVWLCSRGYEVFYHSALKAVPKNSFCSFCVYNSQPVCFVHLLQFLLRSAEVLMKNVYFD